MTDLQINAPSVYDLLDVDPDATAAEIRGAWKAAIAELDPNDRRFRAYNQAAEVLLDPTSRADYDASLADQAAVEQSRDAEDDPQDDPVVGQSRHDEPNPVVEQSRDRNRALPAALALLSVLALVAAAWIWATHPSAAERDADTRAAQAAAEKAIVPVLSYDYADLAGSREAARSELTAKYAAEYDKFFSVIEENAPGTKSVVSAKVISSGLVRTGDDRVEVLVFVDRPTTNKATEKPIVYRDQVTVTMVKQGDSWLIDGLKTSPARS